MIEQRESASPDEHHHRPLEPTVPTGTDQNRRTNRYVVIPQQRIGTHHATTAAEKSDSERRYNQITRPTTKKATTMIPGKNDLALLLKTSIEAQTLGQRRKLTARVADVMSDYDAKPTVDKNRRDKQIIKLHTEAFQEFANALINAVTGIHRSYNIAPNSIDDSNLIEAATSILDDTYHTRLKEVQADLPRDAQLTNAWLIDDIDPIREDAKKQLNAQASTPAKTTATKQKSTGPTKTAHETPKTLRTAFATYTIGKRLGEGGPSTVHEATTDDGTTVAIKILRPDQAQQRDRVKRFKNEINFGRNNTHENIVTISDHGITTTTEDGRPFYVMPRFAGSLRDRMKAGIPAAQVLPLFDQLLSGTDAAHSLRIIHRDLKPENILFDATNNRFLIADFGIARFHEEQLATSIDTKPGDRLANHLYAAPEQRQAKKAVDHRADIYALGLILNELFTKQIPFGKNHPTIAEITPNLGYLDGLVDRMLDQDPAKRPQSINDIKLELAARGNAFIRQQQLDKARNIVISATDVTDPIVTKGVTITKADIDNTPQKNLDGYLRPPRLVLTLSQPVNDRWIHHLRHADSVSYDGNHPPEAYGRDHQNHRVVIELETDDVQRILNQSKALVTRATERYAQELREIQEKTLRARQQEKTEELRRLEKCDQLLNKIQL